MADADTTARNDKISLCPSSGNYITVKDFAERVQEGLAAADDNFEIRRELIEMLDVQVRLAIEDSKKIAYVQCRLGEKRL